MLKLNKKGSLAWEYIVAFALVLILVIVMLFFIDTVKQTIIEQWNSFVEYMKEAVGL